MSNKNQTPVSLLAAMDKKSASHCVDMDEIREALGRLAEQGRTTLLEPEALPILDALTISVPQHQWLKSDADIGAFDPSRFKGKQVVVKIVSERILHKAESGGVRVAENTVNAVLEAIRIISAATGGKPGDNFLVEEFVPYSPALGSEVLLSIHWTCEFGTVLTISPGGSRAEHLTRALKPDLAHGSFSPEFLTRESLIGALNQLSMFSDARPQGFRRSQIGGLVEICLKLLQMARDFVPFPVRLLEINPLVFSSGNWLALDAFCRLGIREALPPAKPLEKLELLLKPRTIAIAGVSRQINPGRTMVQKTLQMGFPRRNLFVLRPDGTSVDACPVVGNLQELPGKVDLLVISVQAPEATRLTTEAIRSGKANNILLIPGGFEEKQGSGHLAERIVSVLRESRFKPDRGPLINGGNCLGIRCVDGHYDTLFIPQHKLRLPRKGRAPLALITQSGAIGAALLSNLNRLNPALIVTVGNQLDLTVADYLESLKDRDDIRVVTTYVESFPPGDGLRFLKAAQSIRRRGGVVLLYRAGRTAAGGQAAASHTGAIAGSYGTTQKLCRQAGVLLAETFAELEGLTRLCIMLENRTVGGPAAAGLSNAGFECVAIADNLRNLHLARFQPKTVTTLRSLLGRKKIDGLVDIRNPLDLTPMADDEIFAGVVRAVLEDANVDVTIVCCVPLSPSLNTLSAPEASFQAKGAASVVKEFIRIQGETRKAWICVVDSGPQYRRMVQALEEAEIPVLPKADLATRLFDIYCTERLTRTRTEHTAQTSQPPGLTISPDTVDPTPPDHCNLQSTDRSACRVMK